MRCYRFHCLSEVIVWVYGFWKMKELSVVKTGFQAGKPLLRARNGLLIEVNKIVIYVYMSGEQIEIISQHIPCSREVMWYNIQVLVEMWCLLKGMCLY